MVSSDNREKLNQALLAVAERCQRDGTRLTVVAVAEEAGISRATANRDLDFLAAFKRAASDAAAAGVKTRRNASGRRQLVSDLRRTVDDMANVIQVLSLAYEKLEAEVDRLREDRSGGAVVPFPKTSRGRRR